MKQNHGFEVFKRGGKCFDCGSTLNYDYATDETKCINPECKSNMKNFKDEVSPKEEWTGRVEIGKAAPVFTKVCRPDMSQCSNGDTMSDPFIMSEGLAQELKDTVYKHVVMMGGPGGLQKYMELLTAFVDSRIELREAQLRPIEGLKDVRLEETPFTPEEMANHIGALKKWLKGRNRAGERIEISGDDPKPDGWDKCKEPHQVKASIQDSNITGSREKVNLFRPTTDDNLEPLPAFIPLTEDNPGDNIRNGDRFNYKGKTLHIRYEKQFIPGLRELEVKPHGGYEPVEPGDPFEDEIKCESCGCKAIEEKPRDEMFNYTMCKNAVCEKAGSIVATRHYKPFHTTKD